MVITLTSEMHKFSIPLHWFFTITKAPPKTSHRIISTSRAMKPSMSFSVASECTRKVSYSDTHAKGLTASNDMADSGTHA